jgi:hypothetical protein
MFDNQAHEMMKIFYFFQADFGANISIVFISGVKGEGAYM